MDTEKLTQALAALHAGDIIVYPTDTVYGLGADATNPVAVEALRAIKGRDATKPILAMVADMDMLLQYAHVTPLARRLADTFLPGPLTLVLEARSADLDAVAGAERTVGFRMPDNTTCLAMTRAFGKPITSTSVNKSGMPQPHTLQAMLEQLGDAHAKLAYVLDEGELPQSPASTVVDARGERAVILREGAVSREQLGAFLV